MWAIAQKQIVYLKQSPSFGACIRDIPLDLFHGAGFDPTKRSNWNHPGKSVPKIIREKYENGVLVERQTEGSNTTPWHWLMLVVHTVIAISLVALVAISIHDSLTLRAAMSEEDASQTSCEQPRLRS
jgi:hypothetical protein